MYFFCQNCLQLCLKNNCFPSMVYHLLQMGMKTNNLDCYSNTALHLIILHDNNIRSLEFLIKSVDLKLLLFYNDDGLTPIHLAIHYNRYLMLEWIFNYLDIRINGKKIFERPADELDVNFQSFYFNECKEFVKNCVSNNEYDNINPFKKKLLEAPEMRTGNTILTTAVINNMGKRNKFQNI